MGSWHWKVREWLLQPLADKMEEEMAKDRDAVKDLEKLLDDQTKAIESVEAHIAADEDTDYAAIKPLVEKAAANNARLASLTGVAPNGVDVSQPVDANTGENVVDSGPVLPPSDSPVTEGNASSDNTGGTSAN